MLFLWKKNNFPLFTLGTDVCRKWKPGDPQDRKLPGDRIVEFLTLAKCGDEIEVDDAVLEIFQPGFILQRKIGFDLYITDRDDVKYCDSCDVKLLGKWSIDIPITFSLRPILFVLCFGEHEIEATAFNLESGDKCDTTFELDI